MLVAAAGANNATWKARSNSSPYHLMYGEKKVVSRFRTFRCKAYIYLEPVRRDGPSRFADRAVEGINLVMATDCNISAYKILVNRSIKITNQVTIDESTFPMKAHHPTMDAPHEGASAH